jgi:hypothetical protein
MDHGLPRQAAGVKTDIVEQALHHGRQAARTDVLGALVDVKRNLRQAGDAFGVNSSVTFSVASKAWYCLTSEAWVCVRMASKSCTDSDCSSTRIGKRPCNSGIRSLGLLR